MSITTMSPGDTTRLIAGGDRRPSVADDLKSEGYRRAGCLLMNAFKLGQQSARILASAACWRRYRSEMVVRVFDLAFVPCQVLPHRWSMTEPEYDIVLPAAPETEAELDVTDIWRRADTPDPAHPYLARYGVLPQHLRQIGDHLVAPLTARDGSSLIGLRLVDPNGTDDVYPAAADTGCFVLEHDSPTRVIIVQGTVADALAVHASTAARVLQVSSAPEALKLHAKLSADGHGIPVLVAFSSDEVAAALSPVGERLAYGLTLPPGLTWAELHACSGPIGVASWLDDPALIFGGVILPDHLAVRASGLWTCLEGRCLWRMGGAVAAIALAHDENKQDWQRVIYLRDRDGSDRFLFVPEHLFWQNQNKVAAALINAGFEFGTGCADRLVRGLLQTSVEKRLIVVTRPGWHGTHYVRSGGTIGPRSPHIPVLAGSVGTAPAISADRLDLWRGNVGRYAEGNSRLTAALGIALGGVAIGLFDGQLGIGLHLNGPSSLGKTTALRVAASAYGPAHKEVRSWSATDNGLETLAVRHHHRSLILDELAQIRPEAAAQAAYLLANGSGRQRASGSGRARPAGLWQLTFLSSGEISLEQKVAERSGAPQVREGQTVRLIDLPADAGRGHGIYEDLHGFADGAALSDALNQATEASMGDVADEFARAIADGVEQARAFLLLERESFVRSNLPDEADGIVRRVYSNLGFLAAATELATRKGILPWRLGSGHMGIGICARAWLSAGRLRSETVNPLAIARNWLVTNKNRLTPWELAARSADEAGYYCQRRGMVYLNAGGWHRLCGEAGSAQVQEALKAAGAFRYTNARPPNGKSAKFYIINCGIVCDGSRER